MQDVSERHDLSKDTAKKWLQSRVLKWCPQARHNFCSVHERLTLLLKENNLQTCRCNLDTTVKIILHAQPREGHIDTSCIHLIIIGNKVHNACLNTVHTVTIQTIQLDFYPQEKNLI